MLLLSAQLLRCPTCIATEACTHSLALVCEAQLQLECLLAGACTQGVQGAAEGQVQVLLCDLWHKLLRKLNSKQPDLLQHVLLRVHTRTAPRQVDTCQAGGGREALLWLMNVWHTHKPNAGLECLSC